MRWLAVAVIAGCLPIQALSAEGLITGRPYIVDGDTIHVGTTVVRLHGIDAPEAAQSCNAAAGGTWPCGTQATRALQSIIGEHDVTCQPLKLDRHHRTVARCFVGAIDIEAEMVTGDSPGPS
jgi:endonuclease YncB( thermonuclease family)